jgi:uncharacterized membrane protein
LIRINIVSSFEIRKWAFAGKVTCLSKSAGAVAVTLLLLLASQFSTLVSANGPIVSESLTLTAYLDGFVLVDHRLELNETYPSVNVSLLGEAYEEFLVVDEQNLPLDYSLNDGEAVVYSLGASQIKLSYFTPDLTSKTGKYWTLSTEVSTNATIVLPADASIISLNNVPELIESSNDQVSLVMPAGIIEITYVAEHSLQQQNQSDDTWLLIIIISFSIIASIVLALWFLRRKKPPPPEEVKNEVDVDKLLEKEKNLRPEEVQVITFLAEKNGTAFEAELYEKLNLPRTTTWRLLKRLEKMEIVDIRKSRRQNIIAIRKKYMKK